MSDWKNLPDAAPKKSWRDLPDVAEGEPGHPGHDMYAAGPAAHQPTGPAPLLEPPEDSADKAARERHEKQALANSLSGGQWLQDVSKRDPIAAEQFVNKQNEGALGSLIAAARGVPFVGSHIDELSAALQSRSLGGEDYNKKLEAARGAVNQSVKANPVLPVATSLAFLPAMPGSALGRVAFNTAAGASEGIGAAPSLKEAPGSAAKDAVASAITTALLEGVTRGGNAVGTAMERGAESQALKAAGLRGGISNQVQRKLGLSNMEEARALGRDFLDEGLIPFAGSKDSVEKAAERLQAMSGNAIGAELARAQASGKPFDYAQLAAAARDPLLVAPGKSTAVADQASGKARGLADALEAQGQATPGNWVEANRAKSDAWKAANFADDAPVAAQLYRQSVGAARDNIENQIKAALGPEAANSLREANRRYGVAADALKLARDSGTREQANSSLGLREQLMLAAGLGGGAGAGLGHAPEGLGLGIAGAIANNWGRKHGNAAAAVLLDKLAAPVGAVGKSVGAASRAAEPLAPYLDLLAEDKAP